MIAFHLSFFSQEHSFTSLPGIHLYIVLHSGCRQEIQSVDEALLYQKYLNRLLDMNEATKNSIKAVVGGTLVFESKQGSADVIQDFLASHYDKHASVDTRESIFGQRQKLPRHKLSF